MPYILRRFDYTTTYNTCMYLWPVTFAFLPLFNALAHVRPPAHSEGFLVTGTGTAITTVEVGMWIGLALVLALSKVAAIPYSITMLLIKRHTSVGISSTRSSYYTGGTGIGRATTAATGTETETGSGSGSGLGSAALGRSNGLVQFSMCVGRAIGPVVVSALFTTLNGSTWARRWGVEWMWSAVMVAFAVVGARVTSRIR